MNTYPSHKYSGIEWAKEVPENWSVKPLFSIAEKNRKKNISLQEKTVLSLSYGKIIERDVESNFGLLPESFNTYQIIDDGYIVLRLTDLQNDKKSLRVGLAKQKGIITSAYVGLVFTDCHSTYIYYLLSCYDAQKVFYNYGSGVRQNMTFSDLRRLPIIKPSLKEQTKIAAYLDCKTKQIETLITQKQKLIELLKEERSAIINHAVTKGINPKAKLKLSGIDWLGEVPEHWEVKKVKYLGKIVSGHSFKSDDFIEKNGCRVMKISNIQTMSIDWSDESFVPQSFYDLYPNFQIFKNDLVFALTRPIISTGIKAAIVDSEEKILLNQRNAVLKPTNLLNVKWMYFLIFNPRFVDYFESLIDKTGQQPNISSTDIANIPIPLPPRNEQDEIIKFILIEQKRIETIIIKTQQEIELMMEYKTALISEVVTGKMDVRDEVIK
jgi:type I restriction enzyme S subunit